ncbi:N-acyl-aromatic-L-amino acid amidohydrolase (carboxylate-forming) [Trichechus inunguis]
MSIEKAWVFTKAEPALGKVAGCRHAPGCTPPSASQGHCHGLEGGDSSLSLSSSHSILPPGGLEVVPAARWGSQVKSSPGEHLFIPGLPESLRVIFQGREQLPSSQLRAPSVRLCPRPPSSTAHQHVLAACASGALAPCGRDWEHLGELQRPSFSATPVLANPEATAACRRYVRQDLNRAFTSPVLTARAAPDDSYEMTRAQELNQLLGPKVSGRAFDFILDPHNTTANMGTCLIANATDVFAMHLGHHLKLQNPELPCRVFLYQLPEEENFSLNSVAKNAMGLELGPQPQGVLRADIFSWMRSLVGAALDFIELFNQGTAFPAFEMEAYRTVGLVDFPRTEDGDLAGTVHPQLQDRDFEPLWPGAPIFQMFSGKDVLYEGETTVYPAFISEVAYYEKGTAFIQTEKLTFSVPALPALTPTPSRDL